MKKILISIICFMFIVSGCTKTNTQGNKNVCDDTCTKADMSDYEGFEDSDHVFVEISMKQANEFLLDQDFTGIIYYGYPDCPWCSEAVPIMNTAAKAEDVTIYYVNKHSDLNSENPTWEKEAVSILDATITLDTNDDGEPTLYVPEVIVVKDGSIVADHEGTFEDHNAHERKMSDEEVSKLTKIYKNMFKKIKE